MGLELDDLQALRHTSATVAQHAMIMYEALLAEGFESAYAQELHMHWWKHIWNASAMPDFSKLLEGFKGES